MGYVYILTNPAFPDYIKIGYAENVEQKVEEFNLYVPLPFCIYATYEVNSDIADKKLRSVIDRLNPNLCASRDFYTISPEDIYSILEAIAQIHGCGNKLRLLCFQNNDPNRDRGTRIPVDRSVDRPVSRGAAMTISVEKSLRDDSDSVQSEKFHEKVEIARNEDHRERPEQFPFDLCNIPVGAELEFYQEGNKNSGVKCKLIDIQGWRKENLEYQNKRYSLSNLAKELIPSESDVQGALFFKYKGELLIDIRKRLGV